MKKSKFDDLYERSRYKKVEDHFEKNAGAYLKLALLIILLLGVTFVMLYGLSVAFGH
ncbi:hypothetical protein L6259_02675 [Candidatus Parcubacteria bacterium]|nr:hypothetical protein [Patescibacteria group bacterium]MCG2694150.1 hypothetical protein [Candidatus Parcubacteria bacterium]